MRDRALFVGFEFFYASLRDVIGALILECGMTEHGLTFNKKSVILFFRTFQLGGDMIPDPEVKKIMIDGTACRVTETANPAIIRPSTEHEKATANSVSQALKQISVYSISLHVPQGSDAPYVILVLDDACILPEQPDWQKHVQAQISVRAGGWRAFISHVLIDLKQIWLFPMIDNINLDIAIYTSQIHCFCKGSATDVEVSLITPFSKPLIKHTFPKLPLQVYVHSNSTQ